MNARIGLAAASLMLPTLACSLPFFGQATPTPSPEPTETPMPTITPTPLPPTATPLPPPETVPEAILILEPGPGSYVPSPLFIAGEARIRSGESLAVRILFEDGTQFLRRTIQTDPGSGDRVSYEITLAFTLEEDRQGFVQVFTLSNRDRGVTHLNSVGVTLSSEGEEEVEEFARGEFYRETIVLQRPGPGEELSGGVIRVEGFGLASFEGTLVIEIQDAAGTVIGSRPVIVDAPDIGQPGAFSADVLYSVAERQQGRVVVRDISPAFGGDVHLVSVEVILNP